MERLEGGVRGLRGVGAGRGGGEFHGPQNLVMAVASEAGELLAEYRWVSNAEADEYSKQEEHRKRIAAEAADVGIALLLFCDRISLDLIDAIREKMALNRGNYPVEESRGRWQRPS